MAQTELLQAAYDPWLRLADTIDDEIGWRPTRLPGWTVRDLIHHLTGDVQRALVAVFTPSDAPVDTDEVSYWRAWRPGEDADQAELRGVRTVASTWAHAGGPARQFAQTARALLVALDRADGTAVVTTQDRVLTVDTLGHTLAVEAVVHHLDLLDAAPQPPDPRCLAQARRVTEALLGDPLPPDWDDARAVLVGTGRERLSPSEEARLGDIARRLPAFG